MLFLILAPLCTRAQTVGVVLSGGGANGLAHVGVLRALEENNIPIDYITGTSIGALVGGLYASGYSLDSLENLFTSEEFVHITSGQIEERYQYLFKDAETDASWISINFTKDTIWKIALPTNVVSPVSMDFKIMSLLAPPIAAADYDFDRLMIPFRCLASDIESKQEVVFDRGDLGEAIRASMSYPFYIQPISINGKVMFDGGLYNNFPADVMQAEFDPDVIIGSNVAANEAPPREDDLLSQIKNMLVSKTDYSIPSDTGLIIEPEVITGVFGFRRAKQVMQGGYDAAIARMDEIKSIVGARRKREVVDAKRAIFQERLLPLSFHNIHMQGVNKGQS
ncbi:MAG: patatin-like phospholipase family protein, partial [Bacteroidota bacterium]